MEKQVGVTFQALKLDDKTVVNGTCVINNHKHYLAIDNQSMPGHWVKCVKGTLKVFFNGVEVASEEGEYNGI